MDILPTACCQLFTTTHITNYLSFRATGGVIYLNARYIPKEAHTVNLGHEQGKSIVAVMGRPVKSQTIRKAAKSILAFARYKFPRWVNNDPELENMRNYKFVIAAVKSLTDKARPVNSKSPLRWSTIYRGWSYLAIRGTALERRLWLLISLGYATGSRAGELVSDNCSGNHRTIWDWYLSPQGILALYWGNTKRNLDVWARVVPSPIRTLFLLYIREYMSLFTWDQLQLNPLLVPGAWRPCKNDKLGAYAPVRQCELRAFLALMIKRLSQFDSDLPLKIFSLHSMRSGLVTDVLTLTDMPPSDLTCLTRHKSNCVMQYFRPNRAQDWSNWALQHARTPRTEPTELQMRHITIGSKLLHAQDLDMHPFDTHRTPAQNLPFPETCFSLAQLRQLPDIAGAITMSRWLSDKLYRNGPLQKSVKFISKCIQPFKKLTFFEDHGTAIVHKIPDVKEVNMPDFDINQPFGTPALIKSKATQARWWKINHPSLRYSYKSIQHQLTPYPWCTSFMKSKWDINMLERIFNTDPQSRRLRRPVNSIRKGDTPQKETALSPSDPTRKTVPRIATETFTPCPSDAPSKKTRNKDPNIFPLEFGGVLPQFMWGNKTHGIKPNIALGQTRKRKSQAELQPGSLVWLAQKAGVSFWGDWDWVPGQILRHVDHQTTLVRWGDPQKRDSLIKRGDITTRLTRPPSLDELFGKQILI